MIKNISGDEFVEAFERMNRGENFSREGRTILFDYLEEFEQSTGQQVELDVIALCCEFSEDTPEEIASNYDIDLSECEDEDDIKEAVLEYLEDHTSVMGTTSDTIVYAIF